MGRAHGQSYSTVLQLLIHISLIAEGGRTAVMSDFETGKGLSSPPQRDNSTRAFVIDAQNFTCKSLREALRNTQGRMEPLRRGYVVQNLSLSLGRACLRIEIDSETTPFPPVVAMGPERCTITEAPLYRGASLIRNCPPPRNTVRP